jgi:hypothetical protein
MYLASFDPHEHIGIDLLGPQNVVLLGFYTYCLTTFSKHSQIFIKASTYDIMTCGKFHDFLTLFVFYTILKQLDGKFTVMFSELGAQSFQSAPEIGRNLC